MLGAIKIEVGYSRSLSDGTVVQAIVMEGYALFCHFKIDVMKFDHGPRPTRPTFGWDVEGITGVHPTYKTLMVRPIHEELFKTLLPHLESPDYTESRLRAFVKDLSDLQEEQKIADFLTVLLNKLDFKSPAAV